MIITITQPEIETAIKQFIGRSVSLKDGSTLDIELRATRGPDGTTAVINIADPSVPAYEPKAITTDSLVSTPEDAKAEEPAQTKVVTLEAHTPVEAPKDNAPEPEPKNETAAAEAVVETPSTPARSIFASRKAQE